MQHLRNALHLIFWGTLLVCIDFHYSQSSYGKGIKFDFIPDIVGAIMIFIGVFRISKIEIINASYSKNMAFVVTAAFLVILLSFDDFFIYPESDYSILFKKIADYVITAATVFFSMAMLILSQEKELKVSCKNWKIAKNLFLWLYLIPTLFFECLSWIDVFPITYIYKLNEVFGTTSSSSNVGNIVVIFLTFFVFLLLPIIFGLYTIQRMRKEIKELTIE